MQRSTSHSHAVVILAAGASKRLGTHKQLVTLDGESLIDRTIRLALTTHPHQTVLVLGHATDEIAASLAIQPTTLVNCTDWREGMGASLRCGIGHVDAVVDGALILLCDQWRLGAMHLQSVCTLWRSHPENIVASGYSDTMGVPALFPRRYFDDLLQIQGDEGARSLLRRATGVRQVAAPELAADVDNPGDLSANFS